MTCVWRKFESTDVDEPVEVWSELDSQFREVRRVELYPDGQMYACGAERGNPEALSPDPVDPNDSGAEETRTISGSVFAQVWSASLERPDALMGLYN